MAREVDEGRESIRSGPAWRELLSGEEQKAVKLSCLLQDFFLFFTMQHEHYEHLSMSLS
jgi:hypothetical protein